MGKIALTLLFHGGSFHGWQVQKNSFTIQQAVQNALEGALGFRPDVTGCSRTDAGVHANEFVCHIDSDRIAISPEGLPKAINTQFTRDKRTYGKIAVKSAEYKEDDFHARYSSVGKEYVYKIWNAHYRNPFLEGNAFFYPKNVEIADASFACEEFAGTHDFYAFMAKGSKSKENTIRTVNYFKVKKENELIEISVCADGFLYNMVRIMVGTYLLCATENYKKGDIAQIIEQKNRALAGDTAPAHGLYLNKVFY